MKGWPSQPADLPCALAQRSRKRLTSMDDGRREKRSPQKIVLLLSNGMKRVIAERVSTENISASGARIRTARPWKQDTRVFVESVWRELRTPARVVYCQTLPDTTFAVGLEFLVSRMPTTV